MLAQLITALTRRIRAFERGVPGAVLDQQALIEAGTLVRLAVDADGYAFMSLQLLGWLRWYRYLALPEADNQNDLRIAIDLFTTVAEIDAQAVPKPVRQYLPTGGDSADPGRWEAFDLLQRAMDRDDPAALNQAIERQTTAVAVTPADHPERAGMLSNLGVALYARFRRTGADADLDEAVAVGREAIAANPADPDRARQHSNLGTALRTRFERTGVGTDLDEAAPRPGRQ